MQIRIFTWAGQNVISTGFSNSCVRCGCAMTFIIRVLTALSLWEIKKVSLAFLYFPWKSSMKSIWYGNKWVEFSLKISRSKEHSLKIPSCSQSDKKKNVLKLKSSLRKKILSKNHTKCRSTTYAELFIAVNGSNIIHTACPSSVKKDVKSIPEACISMN